MSAAAELQRLLPDAVLVGGTAAAIHAGHRVSLDADHVLSDMRERFDDLVALLEGREDWITNRLRPPNLILGNLRDVETGLRQLIRSQPLDVVRVETDQGTVTVPTLAEMLRIKGWLCLQRNATRDYIDVAALSARLGDAQASAALSAFDDCYRDVYRADEGRDVSAVLQLARQLADPRPYDLAEVDLPRYRGIAKPWDEWAAVAGQCIRIATLVATRLADA